jgi:hypothetical protein
MKVAIAVPPRAADRVEHVRVALMGTTMLLSFGAIIWVCFFSGACTHARPRNGGRLFLYQDRPPFRD